MRALAPARAARGARGSGTRHFPGARLQAWPYPVPSISLDDTAVMAAAQSELSFPYYFFVNLCCSQIYIGSYLSQEHQLPAINSNHGEYFSPVLLTSGFLKMLPKLLASCILLNI